MPFLLLIAFVIGAALRGVDSRPADIDRATHWFAGVPRE